MGVRRVALGGDILGSKQNPRTTPATTTATDPTPATIRTNLHLQLPLQLQLQFQRKLHLQLQLQVHPSWVGLVGQLFTSAPNPLRSGTAGGNHGGALGSS